MGNTHEAGRERIVGEDHCSGVTLALEERPRESCARVSLPAPTGENLCGRKLDVVACETLTQADKAMFRVK